MHCELVIPGLFASPPAGRAAGLELLLARGRCASTESQHLETWLAEAFGLGDKPLAAGALTLLGSGDEPGTQCWSRADPVDLRLLRDRVILVPGAALRIREEEAKALCEIGRAHV